MAQFSEVGEHGPFARQRPAEGEHEGAKPAPCASLTGDLVRRGRKQPNVAKAPVLRIVAETLAPKAVVPDAREASAEAPPAEAPPAEAPSAPKADTRAPGEPFAIERPRRRPRWRANAPAGSCSREEPRFARLFAEPVRELSTEPAAEAAPEPTSAPEPEPTPEPAAPAPTPEPEPVWRADMNSTETAAPAPEPEPSDVPATEAAPEGDGVPGARLHEVPQGDAPPAADDERPADTSAVEASADESAGTAEADVPAGGDASLPAPITREAVARTNAIDAWVAEFARPLAAEPLAEAPPQEDQDTEPAACIAPAFAAQAGHETADAHPLPSFLVGTDPQKIVEGEAVESDDADTIIDAEPWLETAAGAVEIGHRERSIWASFVWNLGLFVIMFAAGMMVFSLLV